MYKLVTAANEYAPDPSRESGTLQVPRLSRTLLTLRPCRDALPHRNAVTHSYWPMDPGKPSDISYIIGFELHMSSQLSGHNFEMYEICYGMTWDETMSHHLMMQDDGLGPEAKPYQNGTSGIWQLSFEILFHIQEKSRLALSNGGHPNCNHFDFVPRVEWSISGFSAACHLLMTLPMHFGKTDLSEKKTPQQKLKIQCMKGLKLKLSNWALVSITAILWQWWLLYPGPTFAMSSRFIVHPKPTPTPKK